MPIDPDFQKKRKKVSKVEGMAIWGPVDPPKKLGIRGTNIAVDWDICTGCGICLEVCPVHMYNWRETPGHPTSEKKAFPARASDCVFCYKCENQCPAQAIRVVFGGSQSVWDSVFGLFMTAQFIIGPIYGAIFGPSLSLKILWYFGWIVLALGLPFLLSPFIYYPKSGKPQKGKSLMDTTVLVDSGTYAIVRHPQFLGFFMLIFASILISQHWLFLINGISLMVWFYREIPKAEKGLIYKFDDAYERYMEKVPRMNFLLGIIRLLSRKRE